jgi:hypothetical protein
MNRLAKGIITLMFVAVAAGMAQAGPLPPTNVPEIDPSVASSALALLAGGVMILAAKLRR